jgi:hypothetical protein
MKRDLGGWYGGTDIGMDNLTWLYWCSGLTVERWRQECRLVEERYSLFRSFAEPPFFGFRGVVARCGSEYRVSVAAEMDMYPKLAPWVYVQPRLAGAKEIGKLSLNLHWDAGASGFADAIRAVIMYIEGANQPSAEIS